MKLESWEPESEFLVGHGEQTWFQKLGSVSQNVDPEPTASLTGNLLEMQILGSYTNDFF